MPVILDQWMKVLVRSWKIYHLRARKQLSWTTHARVCVGFPVAWEGNMSTEYEENNNWRSDSLSIQTKIDTNGEKIESLRSLCGSMYILLTNRGTNRGNWAGQSLLPYECVRIHRPIPWMPRHFLPGCSTSSLLKKCRRRCMKWWLRDSKYPWNYIWPERVFDSVPQRICRPCGQARKVCIEDHTTSFTNTVNTETDTEYFG